MRNKTIQRTILVKDIKDYAKSMDIIADYPLYASTCGIMKSEAVAIDFLLRMMNSLKVGNETRLKITLEIIK